MGVISSCGVPGNCAELNINYDEEKEEKVKEERRAKNYLNNSKVITVNQIELDKTIKKHKTLTNKARMIFDIVNNEKVQLHASTPLCSDIGLKSIKSETLSKEKELNKGKNKNKKKKIEEVKNIEEIINDKNKEVNVEEEKKIEESKQIVIESVDNIKSIELKEENNLKKMIKPKKKYDIINYPKDCLKLINSIRKNPELFIKEIEKAKNKIIKINEQLIYKGNLSIILNEGGKIFQETIDFLKTLNPMKELKVDDNIKLEMPSEEEFNDKNRNIFKEKVLEKRKIYNLDGYFKEAIKDPYSSVLMILIDDNNLNQGMKRKKILDPEMSKIYISCKCYNKKFLAYYSLSK